VIMNKPTFIDLFAGAGGFGLGFQMAGFNPLLSLERDKWAYQTLLENNQHNVLNCDITKLNTATKIRTYINILPEIIIGGPPCQGFSVSAINRVKDKSSKNNLFKYYLKWVKVLKPKIFVIENVPGIITQKNDKGNKIIEIIRKQSNKMDYHITIWRLNALNYGVPQNRERVFIIGAKDHSDIPIPKPTHHLTNRDKSSISKKLNQAITVGEAILDLPEINAREGFEIMDYTNGVTLSNFQKWSRKGSKKVFNHVAMKHTERVVKRYENILAGVKEMPNEFKVRKRSGGGQLSNIKFNQNYRHLNSKQVSYTIPASFYSSFIHPTIPRNITAREAARLQSFPDWYVFKGKRTIVSNSLLKRLGKEEEIYLSQYNQIGNAVPPLLAKAVAKHIKKLIF